MGEIARCAFGRWQPGIGDPTVLGWVTVAIYLSVALLAFRVRAGASFPMASRRRERGFWLCLGLFLLFMALNKQLDLQSFMTVTGRCAAKIQGWYETRRAVQGQVLLAMALAGGAIFIGLFWLMRGSWRRNGLAVLGLSLTAVFIAVRAVGFHHFDHLLGVEVLYLRLNGWFELAGPALIALAALLLLRRRTQGNSDL